jgi:hypothetical protein
MSAAESPAYYRAGPFECIDVIDALALGYNLGCALKYLWRCGRKGGPDDAILDLRKAVTYIEREIQRRERVAGGGAS